MLYQILENTKRNDHLLCAESVEEKTHKHLKNCKYNFIIPDEETDLFTKKELLFPYYRH